jgi:V/A-type H+-transporting ATPase subunit C
LTLETEILESLSQATGIPLIFLVLGIIAGVIGLILLFGWILKIIMDVAPFAYPNARIGGMKSRLLTRSRYDDLLEASSAVEMVGMLEGTGYEEEITSMGVEDVSRLEIALNNSLSDTYYNLVRMAPKSIKGILDAKAAKVYEVEVLKTVLRALYGNRSVQKELEYTIPLEVEGVGLESFYDLRSIDELPSKMEGTKYGEVIEGAMASYAEKKSIQPIEFALDKYAYECIWKAITTTSDENAKLLKIFFGTEIDIINLKTLLRAKRDAVPAEVVKEYLLPVGYELPMDELEALADANDVQSIVSALEDRRYGEGLLNALGKYEEKNSLVPLETALDSFMMKTGVDVSTSQSIGVGPFIGYLSAKEMEVRNLRAIIRGVEERLPKELIKDLLVS